MSVYRIVSQNPEDESVEWYGAEVGDLLEVVQAGVGRSEIWVKVSKVHKLPWCRYEKLATANTLEDFLKYVEKV